MKTSVILILLGATALFAAPPKSESIAAGPFRATVPKEFAEGVVVEKIAFSPLYSDDAWAEKELDPTRQLKPGYCIRPQHWAIRLPKAAPEWYKVNLETSGDNPTAPQILIHKSDEWAAAFENGKVDATSAAKRVAGMREDLALWGKQPMDSISPGYMDASTAFDCLKKQIQFEGGSGVRGIVQWNMEPNLARRGQLHYLFLGLSDDGSCQIIATFPLDLPGLPDDSQEATHLGYSTKEYEKLSKEFDTYEGEVKKWLIANENKFNPKLEELDTMMAGLVVKRWE
jgi:hypothetical protein